MSFEFLAKLIENERLIDLIETIVLLLLLTLIIVRQCLLERKFKRLVNYVVRDLYKLLGYK
jgi:hypothetical protein